MNIGITTIYAHRPIIFFAAYLAKLLKENGDHVSSMVCDSSLPTCYSILSKGKNKLTECPLCIVGGLRSFNIDSYFSINRHRKFESDQQILADISLSSVMTLERAEQRADVMKMLNSNNDIHKLNDSVAITFQNTIDWITKDKLELVICYNGRMDATRAVIKACEYMGVKYISLERSIYGYGLQLIPNNNCLSIRDRIKINKQFKDVSLSKNESIIADWLAETRISQKSHLEWRTYSSDSIATEKFTFPKILILPSSNCEFIGNPEWDTPWGHFSKALDQLLTRANFSIDSLAIKMHPVWDQYIGRKDGKHITELYSKWALKNNIQIIDSQHKISTNDLIKQAEYIIVGGSSAGIDAALLGKKVILLGHAHYEGAGFVCHIANDSEWINLNKIDKMDPDNIKEIAKRYLYSSTFRYNQLANKVIPLNYFDYLYKKDSLNCIYSMLDDNELKPWEINLTNYDIEKEINQHGKLIFRDKDNYISVKRRFVFRLIDSIRQLTPRGDQIRQAKK